MPAQTGGATAASPGLRVANEYRLRIFLGGGQPARWRGRIGLDAGRVTELSLLDGVGAAQAPVTLSNGGLVVRALEPLPRIAVDVTVSAPLDAEFRLTLQAGGAGRPVEVSAPLDAVLRSPLRRRLSDSGAELLVHRAAADRVRIQTSRQQLIFDPGERFSADVTIALPDLSAATPLDVRLALLRGRRGDAVWSAPPERLITPVEGWPTTHLALPLPEEPGVYTVRIVVTEPPGSVEAWLPRRSAVTLAQREFQVVVDNPGAQPDMLRSESKPVEIDPTTRRWRDLLPRVAWRRRASWLSEGRPLGSGDLRVVSRDGDTPFEGVQLPPARGGESPWQAYPLPVDAPGEPHVIEIDYPSDEPQQLVATIVDEDRFGSAAPLGDAALADVGPWIDAGNGTRTVRKVFWPRTTSPLLVLANGSAAAPVRYEAIRLRRLAHRDPIEPRGGAGLAGRLLASVDRDAPGLLHASLGGPPLHEDWQTYRETIDRLGDWLHFAGFDGAVVTAASSRGLLYPSEVLGTVAPPDREQLVRGVTDLPDKDVLGLLLRDFGRRGLRVVPALRLAELLQEPPPPSGEAESPTADAGSPARAAIAELLDRYGEQQSLAGVAIDLAGAERADEWAPVLKQIAGDLRRREASIPLLVVPPDQTNGPRHGAPLPSLGAGPHGGGSTPALDLHGGEGTLLIQRRHTIGIEPLWSEALRVAAGEQPTDPRAAPLITCTTQPITLRDFERLCPLAARSTRGISWAAATGDALLRSYSRVSQGPPPPVVLEGGGMPMATSLPLRSTRRHAPRRPPSAQRLERVEASGVRAVLYERDGASVVRLCNPLPWAGAARVTVFLPRACRGAQSDSGTVDASAEHGPGDETLTLQLPPLATREYRFDTTGVELRRLRAELSPRSVDDLTAHLEDLRGRDLTSNRGVRSAPAGSFESDRPGGVVSDWSAVPPDASGVSITTDRPADGRQAVRLISDGPGVGVQSRPFPSPETGQLAVVFRLRATRVEPDAVLRVVFEQPGGPYRSYTEMTDRQLRGTPDSWRQWVFAVDDLPLGGPARMRVRFALAGGGQVDVDALEFYGLTFPLDLGVKSNKQRFALVKTLQSAESALQAGHYADCLRQVDGYWPRFLRAYTPPTPPAAVAGGQPPDGRDPAHDAPPAKVGGRVRDYLPTFLRF